MIGNCHEFRWNLNHYFFFLFTCKYGKPKIALRWVKNPFYRVIENFFPEYHEWSCCMLNFCVYFFSCHKIINYIFGILSLIKNFFNLFEDLFEPILTYFFDLFEGLKQYLPIRQTAPSYTALQSCKQLCKAIRSFAKPSKAFQSPKCFAEPKTTLQHQGKSL